MHGDDLVRRGNGLFISFLQITYSWPRLKNHNVTSLFPHLTNGYDLLISFSRLTKTCPSIWFLFPCLNKFYSSLRKHVTTGALQTTFHLWFLSEVVPPTNVFCLSGSQTNPQVFFCCILMRWKLGSSKQLKYGLSRGPWQPLLYCFTISQIISTEQNQTVFNKGIMLASSIKL